MTSNRLASLSQRMAAVTLCLMVLMLLLNAACWWVPSLNSIEGGYGLGFSLTDSFISNLGINFVTLPGWQKAGGMLLSSVPLLALTVGLYRLRALFQSYGRGEYFSISAANHLGAVGRAVAYWVGLNIVCEPLLSIWLTLQAPSGHHMVTLSFGSSEIVALFLAACIAVIARILRQACEVSAENQQFV